MANGEPVVKAKDLSSKTKAVIEVIRACLTKNCAQHATSGDTVKYVDVYISRVIPEA